jgi:hypothetical protein
MVARPSSPLPAPSVADSRPPGAPAKSRAAAAAPVSARAAAFTHAVDHRPAFLQRASAHPSAHAAVSDSSPHPRRDLPWTARTLDPVSSPGRVAVADRSSPLSHPVSISPSSSSPASSPASLPASLPSAAAFPATFGPAAAPALAPAAEPPVPAAAALWDQAAADPSLRATVTPDRAVLSIDTGARGELELHVHVKDGVTDVRIEGAAAASLDLRAQELSTALAGEGLTLGTFDSGQSGSQPFPGNRGDRADRGERADQPAAAAARARTAAPQSSTASIEPTRAADSGVHVTA